MIAHLRDRSDALVRSGWTRREAEWLALVCLHSGVFLRSHVGELEQVQSFRLAARQ